jgi:heme a synthase
MINFGEKLKMTNRPDKSVIIWLLTGCALIFTMVIIGGITRLTQSGLSIVEWDLLMGTIPPLSDAAWQDLFVKYQNSPQYQLVNYHFNMEEFKSIFWWEYIHRLFGRFIGLVFFLPFLYFLISKKLNSSLIKKLLVIFFLGGFQGFLGWYMVKSGLVKDPAVSHFRLAAHLTTAFFTFGFTFWVALQLLQKEALKVSLRPLRAVAVLLFGVVVIQIIYGAFVAGLKAGHSYTTFPKMGDEWIAESVTFAYTKMGIVSLIENPASVQFVHRIFAILVVSIGLFLWWKVQQIKPDFKTKVASDVLLYTILGQFLLGVVTLIYSVPVALGVLHQAGAFIVFAVCVYFLFQTSRTVQA